MAELCALDQYCIAGVLLVQLIGSITGTFTLTDVMREDILTITNVFLGLLATLGIISNPTKPESGGYNL